MRSNSKSTGEIDLRPVVGRLAEVYPGRVLIGRFPDSLRLSMLPAWRQDERELVADEARMVREPNVVMSAEWEENADRVCSVHVRADRLRGSVGPDARELVFLFSQRLNAVMDGMGLAPLSMDVPIDLYRIRSRTPEDDVLAVASAILGRIKPLVGYDPEKRPMFASRPKGADVPELSPRKRAAALRAFEKREGKGR